MTRIRRCIVISLTGFFLFCKVVTSPASSTLPLTLEQHAACAAAVFRGTVVGLDSFTDANDGLIYTRTMLRVDEPIKGTFPETVRLVHRGGRVGSRISFYGLSPRFRPGGEYLVFVTRREDGQLTCAQGDASALWLQRENTPRANGRSDFVPEDQALLAQTRAVVATSAGGDDVTDQAAGTTAKFTPGLLMDTNGIASRFLLPDRGEPIPFLIDAANWPAGMTLAQATNAVYQAFNAWSAVTSLKFKFDGFANFGMGADVLPANDQRLYVQLHDNYNRITTTNILGVGGSESLASPLPNGWDLGGNVAGNEFYQSIHGYVVLERTNTTLQNTQTLAEVLCHEIGHALAMAHSSETNHTNPTITNSIMYYKAHADGRGASLGAYDPPVIRQAYPFNTAPWSFDRMMEVTTASTGPNLPGINEIEMRGYDLQTSSLSVATNFASVNNGSFAQTGNLIKYTPAAWFSDSPKIDPTDGGSWDDVFLRFSDGTNASPYSEVRVLSYNKDNFSSPSDGIPDNWMIAYFGSGNPNAGTKRQAAQDFDGDGMINLQEFRSGMNPTNTASAQRITLVNPNTIQFQAKPYELYELLGSTNLTTWTRAANPLVPTTATGTFTGFTNNAPYRFFRILKVP